MDYSLFILVLLVTVALAFDFMNGLHDAANSIATIVSTRVLPAKYAVIWAAFFNFIATPWPRRSAPASSTRPSSPTG